MEACDPKASRIENRENDCQEQNALKPTADHRMQFIKCVDDATDPARRYQIEGATAQIVPVHQQIEQDNRNQENHAHNFQNGRATTASVIHDAHCKVAATLGPLTRDPGPDGLRVKSQFDASRSFEPGQDRITDFGHQIWQLLAQKFNLGLNDWQENQGSRRQQGDCPQHDQ